MQYNLKKKWENPRLDNLSRCRLKVLLTSVALPLTDDSSRVSPAFPSEDGWDMLPLTPSWPWAQAKRGSNKYLLINYECLISKSSTWKFCNSRLYLPVLWADNRSVTSVYGPENPTPLPSPTDEDEEHCKRGDVPVWAEELLGLQPGQRIVELFLKLLGQVSVGHHSLCLNGKGRDRERCSCCRKRSGTQVGNN